jgi:hypothetical protein
MVGMLGGEKRGKNHEKERDGFSVFVLFVSFVVLGFGRGTSPDAGEGGLDFGFEAGDEFAVGV